MTALFSEQSTDIGDFTSFSFSSPSKFIDKVIDHLNSENQKMSPNDKSQNELSELSISLLSSIDYSYASLQQLIQLAKYDPQHLFFDLHNYLQIRKFEYESNQRRNLITDFELNARLPHSENLNEFDSIQKEVNALLREAKDSYKKHRERGDNDDSDFILKLPIILEKLTEKKEKLNHFIKCRKEFDEIQQLKQDYRSIMEQQNQIKEKYDDLRTQYEAVCQQLADCGFQGELSDRNLERALRQLETTK